MTVNVVILKHKRGRLFCEGGTYVTDFVRLCYDALILDRLALVVCVYAMYSSPRGLPYIGMGMRTWYWGVWVFLK
jgi:hypothetical protein